MYKAEIILYSRKRQRLRHTKSHRIYYKVLQTALGFMPVVIDAAIIGFGVGIFAINALLTVLFGSIGIMKAMFIIPAGLTIAFAAAIVLFAFGVSCLVSLRVRKITPRELIAG